MKLRSRFKHGRKSITHLSAFVGLAYIINGSSAVVMVLAGDNGIHAAGFTFEGGRDSSVSSTALDL